MPKRVITLELRFKTLFNKKKLFYLLSNGNSTFCKHEPQISKHLPGQDNDRLRINKEVGKISWHSHQVGKATTIVSSLPGNLFLGHRCR